MLNYKYVMDNKTSNDCGFLAIAFAICSANDLDPYSFIFNSQQLRAHLKDCFEKDELSLFPSEPRKTLKRNRVIMTEPVICYCKQTDFLERKKTDTKWETATCFACRKQYHRMCCQSFPEKYDIENMDMPRTFIDTSCILLLHC